MNAACVLLVEIGQSGMPHRCERNFLARVSTRVLPALLAQTESRSLKEYRKTLSGKNSVADLIARRIDDMSGAVA
ncbi:MAG: hypothetical protein ACK4OI_10015, partial [Rhizobium oryzihabitans]